MKSHSIQLLDSTLRDGGLGLEDANLMGLSDAFYSDETRLNILSKLVESRVDIVELGSIEISESDKRQFSIFQSIEDISLSIPRNNPQDQMYVALFRGPDTPIECIPEWHEGLCRGIRLIVRYSEQQKSMDFCGALASKGYDVFVQPMVTMRYSNDELERIIRQTNEMSAYALYIVDSYGYMQYSDIDRLLDFYDSRLNPEIKIGFHAHNNMDSAFSNVKYFLNKEIDRDLIVDSCIMGIGQGAGNMQTELLSDYMIDDFKKDYDYSAILDLCEIVEKYWIDNLWGYSVVRLIPAIRKVAYKYAASLRYKYNLSYNEIDYCFRIIPEELRHRYTMENVETLIRLAGFEGYLRQ